MTASSDKRRAMLVYLRDLADSRAGYEVGCAQVHREVGDIARAADHDRAALAWNAIFLGLAALVSEYDAGISGKYGVPKSVTAILDAMASSYAKARAA